MGMTNGKVKAGIIGGAGYTAGELIRLLINHPHAEIAFINSKSHAGLDITSVHEGLLGETKLKFSEDFDLNDLDVLFLCSGHGESSRFWDENHRPGNLKVIDLAQDFRDESNGFVYGLPELNRKRISQSKLIANPGCFATAIQLSLLPLAKAGLLTDQIHVTALTGSTGAGAKPGATTHFSWRTDNISVYKPFSHQHIPEIERTISSLQPSFKPVINFVPMRGDFARGIFVSLYTRCELEEEKIFSLFNDFYDTHPFTVVSSRPVDLKQAVNTNKAITHLERHGEYVHVTTAIDNLLKGASGQAVQNMNIVFGFDERAGLSLKPSAF